MSQEILLPTGSRPRVFLTTKPPKHFPALTGLRFLLALWVMIHHLTGPGMMLEPIVSSLSPLFQALVRGGWVSVQTFFVLSGVVLAHTYSATQWTRQSLLRYTVARVARVYPGYLLSLLVVSPFIYYTLVHGTGRLWAPAHKTALLFDYALVLQGWTGPLGVGWNTPAWSLSCEFLFYFCFPFIAVVFSRIARSRWPYVAFGIAMVLPVLLSSASIPSSWKPLHHLPDFFMGIAAAGFLQSLLRKRPALQGTWLYIPAAIVFVGIVANAPLIERFTVLNTPLRPVGAILLVGLALAGGSPAACLSNTVMNFLGKASYAMYILHIPLLWWFSRYGVAAYFHLSPAVAACIYLACVILLSSAAYQFVEEPANRAIRKWLVPREKNLAMNTERRAA